MNFVVGSSLLAVAYLILLGVSFSGCVLIASVQWRVVAKISGGAAPENVVLKLTLSLRIIYCTRIKKELKTKGLIILYVIDNIKW
jgi:hypothetical protein